MYSVLYNSLHQMVQDGTIMHGTFNNLIMIMELGTLMSQLEKPMVLGMMFRMVKSVSSVNLKHETTDVLDQ